MKEDKFIKNNIHIWEDLERTLQKLKSKGFPSFNDNELDDFLNAYNSVSSHLSYSRTNFSSSDITVYLNTLVASAHSYIYTHKTSRLKSFFKFFIVDFPVMFKQNLKFFLISTALFVLGGLLSFIYTLISPENAGAFLPQQIIKGVNFKGNSSGWISSIMSTTILTNNIRVGFLAFALGITLGIGTVWVLVNNGFIIGGIAALAFHQGVSLEFWSKILPHGVIELFCIFTCGAAGLILGYAIINPKSLSRKDSLIINGKKAIFLVLGTIPLFVVAGFIEGYFTPAPIEEWFKYLFSIFTLFLLVSYLVIGNRLSKKSYFSDSSSL